MLLFLNGQIHFMEFEIFELSNGLRVVHRQVDRPVAHCGLFISAGSRDELEQEQGLAHFIEHSLFKGTHKRKAYHILSRMEDVGGELNAYTSKEETVIYTSFLAGYYHRAIELLFDIALHSNFPAKEVEKEKEVIIDEINSYLDSPSEAIFDDFEEQIFKGHPIGRNILGTIKSVKSFTRQHILNFIARNYGFNRMVFSSVGNISSKKLKVQLEKCIGQVETPVCVRQIQQPTAYQADKIQTERTGYQTHSIIGCPAYAVNEEKARVLMLLNNLLGGPGMNSRLNLNIREKYGFTYHLESFYQPYSDTGLFGVYLGTDPGTISRALKLVEKELKKLREQKLGILQLSKAKRQVLGQIAMAQENNNALMMAYGKSLLTFNKIDEFDTIREKVENITASDLQEVANEVFNPENLSTLIYKSKLPQE